MISAGSEALHGGFFDKTFPYHPIYDVFRVVAVLLGLLIMVMFLLQLTRRRFPTEDRFWAAGCGAYATFAVIHEILQLGKPLIWWALPCLVVGNLFVLLAMTTRMTYGVPWWRRHERDYHQESQGWLHRK